MGNEVAGSIQLSETPIYVSGGNVESIIRCFFSLSNIHLVRAWLKRRKFFQTQFTGRILPYRVVVNTRMPRGLCCRQSRVDYQPGQLALPSR